MAVRRVAGLDHQVGGAHSPLLIGVDEYGRATLFLLIRCGLRFGRVNLDAALELCAVLDADARRQDIPDDRASFLTSTRSRAWRLPTTLP